MMRPVNRFALKEWAVVVKAMTTSRQLILLRKGGIEDEGGQFRLEHSEFFLYPTFEHQNRKFVRWEFLADFDQAIREQPATDDLIISAYAIVTDIFVAKEPGTLRGLDPYHLWNDDYLKMRLNYKPELRLYVLLLRAFNTPPVRVPYRPEYRGCKSWVELDRELSTANAEPALSDPAFETRRQRIQSLPKFALGR